MENRLVAIWDSGAYISTLHSDFTKEFSKLVAQYGEPDWISSRETLCESSDVNYYQQTT